MSALVLPPLEDDLDLGAALEELAEDGDQRLAVAGDDQDRMIVPMLARGADGADAVRDGGIVRTEIAFTPGADSHHEGRLSRGGDGGS